jgi:hypothetical protein
VPDAQLWFTITNLGHHVHSSLQPVQAHGPLTSLFKGIVALLQKARMLESLATAHCPDSRMVGGGGLGGFMEWPSSGGRSQERDWECSLCLPLTSVPFETVSG